MPKNIYLKRGGYWFSRMRRGKRVWINLETSDPLEAQRRAGEIADSPEIAAPSQAEALIARYVSARLASGHFTARTAEATEAVLRMLMAELGPAMIRAKSADLERWIDCLRKRLAPSSVGTYQMRAAGFYRWMRAKNLRADNPAAKLDRYAIPRPKLERWINTADAMRLIVEAPTDALRFILFCGFHAGLRRNEISEARCNWFDVPNGKLHVRRSHGFTPKDKEERTIDLTREFAAFLSAYLDGTAPDAFALEPSVGRGLWRYRYDFIRPFREYMTAQGFGWLTPHGMRHSFACNLVNGGVPIFHVAEWLGDGVAVVQRHYARLAPGSGNIQRAAP